MLLHLGDIRREKGYTIRELSKISGIAVSHITKIEAQKANPSALVLCKLAKALSVSISDLVTCDERQGL